MKLAKISRHLLRAGVSLVTTSFVCGTSFAEAPTEYAAAWSAALTTDPQVLSADSNQDSLPPDSVAVSTGIPFYEPDPPLIPLIPRAPGPLAPVPSRPEICQCVGIFLCDQVCFALANGSQISAVDFYHIHAMLDPSDNSCRGALGHAHELDGRRTDKPNNFNISSFGGDTKFLDTPPPNTLDGLDAADWDAATGGWVDISRLPSVNFSLAPANGCPAQDASMSCACGASGGGDVRLCLSNCSAERLCSKFSKAPCANASVRSECRNSDGQIGRCVQDNGVTEDCSCQLAPESVR